MKEETKVPPKPRLGSRIMRGLKKLADSVEAAQNVGYSFDADEEYAVRYIRRMEAWRARKRKQKKKKSG